MASEPPPPPSNPPEVPQPGPNATREEWRAWRRQHWRTGWYGPWPWFGWGWFWGAVLVVLGVYFLLNNLGLLGWLRGDIVWPVILILFGIFLIARRGRWWP